MSIRLYPQTVVFHDDLHVHRCFDILIRLVFTIVDSLSLVSQRILSVIYITASPSFLFATSFLFSPFNG